MGRCYSHGCQTHPKLKNNLLGLVRGALTQNPDRPAPLTEAVRFIERFVDRDATRSTSVPVCRASRPAPKVCGWTREAVRSRLVIPSPYFVNRGFSPAVLDRYDIGESRKLNCAIVPIYDEETRKCMAFLSRSTKPCCEFCGRCHRATDACEQGELRWQFPKNFCKGDHLFNYAAAAETSSPFVLLVEGVPDVLRAAEAGVPAVATFGADVSVAQTVKLAALNKPVVVAFDNDAAGRRAAEWVVPALRREGARTVLRHPPDGVKDVGEMTASAVADWFGALAC